MRWEVKAENGLPEGYGSVRFDAAKDYFIQDKVFFIDGKLTESSDDFSYRRRFQIMATKGAPPIVFAEKEEEDGTYYTWSNIPPRKYFPYGNTYLDQSDPYLRIRSAPYWTSSDPKTFWASAVNVNLRGKLDANFTFTGMLTVEEKGDAWGLYSTGRTGNTPAVSDLVRLSLDLPGTAFLHFQEQTTNEAGNQEMRFQVQWPHLMQADLGAYRLSYAVTGYPKRLLTRVDEARVNPIHFKGKPKATFHFKLQSESALTPGLAEAHHEGENHRFQWRAGSGKTLEITFSKETQTRYFPLEQRAEGLLWWSQWRKVFNGFLLKGPVFTVADEQG